MEFWLIRFVELVRCPQQDFLCIVVKILVLCALCLLFSVASETALSSAFNVLSKFRVSCLIGAT